MSAIAYITDSRMLELHRLNNHKTMNFWRLSQNNNFSDFGIGDLVFFLSKDKEHKKKNEKGIVGFGRLSKIDLASIKTMWNRFGILNGYNTYEEFKEAIVKVSKDKKHPGKISGFYLENVNFFQPIYLSECGVNISSNVESYIYLKEETVIRLLELSKNSLDLWSGQTHSDLISNEQLRFLLQSAHKQVGKLSLSEKEEKQAARRMLKYQQENEGFEFFPDCKNELYKIINDHIELVFANLKSQDQRLLIGQALLYRDRLTRLSGKITDIRFKTDDDDKELCYYLNTGI